MSGLTALLFVALLALSLAMGIVLLAADMRRYRARQRHPAVRRALGGGQLVVGLLWVLWGWLYLAGSASGSRSGLFAIALGGLWGVQGLRRLR